jgi:hypothetical protein
VSTNGPVRPLLADAIREEITPAFLRELVGKVKEMQKETFGYCPGCKKKVLVQVPDLPKVISGLTELLEQAEGRPGTATAEDAGVTLIVERIWPGPCPKCGAEDEVELIPPPEAA